MYVKFNDLRNHLPKQVTDFAIGRAKALRIRKIRVELATKLYFDEDTRYTVIRDQVLGSHKTGGEFGGYIKNDFVAKEADIPVGSYIVEEQIFLGKFFITIYHNNGQSQVKAN